MFELYEAVAVLEDFIVITSLIRKSVPQQHAFLTDKQNVIYLFLLLFFMSSSCNPRNKLRQSSQVCSSCMFLCCGCHVRMGEMNTVCAYRVYTFSPHERFIFRVWLPKYTRTCLYSRFWHSVRWIFSTAVFINLSPLSFMAAHNP